MSKFFVKSNQVEGNLIRIEGTDVNNKKIYKKIRFF